MTGEGDMCQEKHKEFGWSEILSEIVGFDE